MKIIKFSAFTLAELLVIMAVLAVLMAALAPMFTARYSNMATGTVWSSVAGDTNGGHIYFDEPNKLLSQQAFVGVTPDDADAAKSGFRPYSKLIIRSRKRDTSMTSHNYQNQIDFYYGSGIGSKVGMLSAFPSLNAENPDNPDNNIIFGGSSSNSMYTAKKTTALGIGSFHDPSSEASNNTAIGAVALWNSSVDGHNVAIGYFASSSSGHHTVTIGPNSSRGWHNVLISNSLTSGDKNNVVLVGYSTSMPKNNSVVLGYDSWTKGGNSVTIGARINAGKGDNGTSIGYNSCYNFLKQVNIVNATCLAVDGAIQKNIVVPSGKHVYIGNSTQYGPATLEVHSDLGGENNRNSSAVIINGDLIVRGQSFFGTHKGGDYGIAAHGIRTNLGGHAPLVPWTPVINRKSVGSNAIHREAYTLSESCECRVNNPGSYDWTNPSATGPILRKEQYSVGNHYLDRVITNDNILNAAYNYDEDVGSSCCPNIRSDARLKNIGEKFTPSYDELLKLAIYNYSYKTEGKKPTRVGVIAQDLKKIFPNAVSKDQNGYLKIRWDEMFYAMVNAVKDLNLKVQNLIAKVETNKAKINNLKADNKKLEQKLDDLAKEIAKLEK